MYHMFIINQQVVGWKSAMPYDSPPHVANFSWLFDQSQIVAHLKNHLQRKSQQFIPMRFSLKAIL